MSRCDKVKKYLADWKILCPACERPMLKDTRVPSIRCTWAACELSETEFFAPFIIELVLIERQEQKEVL